MSSTEIRASILLAFIFSLRMFGLFLILPIFAIDAKNLPGGGNTIMVGLAMGVYGFTQSLGQIPFGIASDKYGRKPIIVIGLVLFGFGAVIAAVANNITHIIIGRAIQGTGAISAAITAFIADSTREKYRTKAMAIVGVSIGITFSISLILSPLLYKSIQMSGIFILISLLALVAIFIVLFAIPNVPLIKMNQISFKEILCHGELMRLNFGVFSLHLIQMSMFVVLPVILEQHVHLLIDEHWKIYLPIILISFIFMFPIVLIGEKLNKIKQVLIGAIIILLIVQTSMCVTLIYFIKYWWILVLLLLNFFIAFNVLEVFQPSLVSRIAPATAKGTALGIYNALQALGLFCGGIFGGWFNQHLNQASVFLMSALITLIWLIIIFNMQIDNGTVAFNNRQDNKT